MAVRPLERAVLVHEILRGLGGNVEDLEDMLIEIPRRQFGLEGGQQLIQLQRLVEGACVPLGPQRMDAYLDLWDRRHVCSSQTLWISMRSFYGIAKG